MQISPSLRTSIKLEKIFWDYLKDLAGRRNLRLSNLISQIAEAAPERRNLASTLRTFAINHAWTRSRKLSEELEQLSSVANSQDLCLLLQACPLPCLVMDSSRTIRKINSAFAAWLNVDPCFTLGQRLESVMIVRANNLEAIWSGLVEGRMRSARVSATYVSPGRMRISQAIVLALSCDAQTDQRNCVLMFTLDRPG
jgi:predicted DNA-binding ribbon-helix-helix protein